MACELCDVILYINTNHFEEPSSEPLTFTQRYEQKMLNNLREMTGEAYLPLHYSQHNYCPNCGEKLNRKPSVRELYLAYTNNQAEPPEYAVPVDELKSILSERIDKFKNEGSDNNA